jgi:hypothetical protein
MWKLHFHHNSHFDDLRPWPCAVARFSPLASRLSLDPLPPRSSLTSPVRWLVSPADKVCTAKSSLRNGSSPVPTANLRIPETVCRSCRIVGDDAKPHLVRIPAIARAQVIRFPRAQHSVASRHSSSCTRACISNFKFEISNLNCRDWIRTSDLKVMSLASYQAALPREDQLQVRESNPRSLPGRLKKDAKSASPLDEPAIRSAAVVVTTSDRRTPSLFRKRKQPADPLPDRGLFEDSSHPSF